MNSGQKYFDLGMCLLAQRDCDQALDYFFRAEAAGVHPDACAAQRWFCWMQLGEFERAWQESDAISLRNVAVENCYWDGLPLYGKRIIIRSLHGYGDAIQFLRYLPAVKRCAARVMVEAHPDLLSLIRSQTYLDSVLTWTDPAGTDSSQWDQQIEVMELPRIFRSSLSTLPCNVPYLQIPADVPLNIQKLLRATVPGDEWDMKPKVGIVWGAGDWDSSRSIPLACVSDILRVQEVTFFSFQHGPHRQALYQLEFDVIDTALFCPSILDTAAALNEMDLLITVDTMAAHLAGALARPVWTMLQWHADWRWMLKREDSPWYPTMRLFRQDKPGDWRAVATRVAAELEDFVTIR